MRAVSVGGPQPDIAGRARRRQPAQARMCGAEVLQPSNTSHGRCSAEIRRVPKHRLLRLRPVEDVGLAFGQRRGERFEVVDVAGQDRFRTLYGHDDEVGVDDVAGTCSRQEIPDFGSVIEGDDHDGLKKPGKACLAGTVAPHLGHDGMGGRQWRVVRERSGEELSSGAFSSIDRDEESGVKNQGCSDRSSPRLRHCRPGQPLVPSQPADPPEQRADGFRRRADEARREVRSICRHGSRPTRRVCALHRGRAEPSS